MDALGERLAGRSKGGALLGALFDAFDANGDGEVDWAEFQVLFAS